MKLKGFFLLGLLVLLPFVAVGCTNSADILVPPPPEEKDPNEQEPEDEALGPWVFSSLPTYS